MSQLAQFRHFVLKLSWPVAAMLWGLAFMLTMGALSGQAHSAENFTFQIVNKTQFPLRVLGNILPQKGVKGQFGRQSGIILPHTMNDVYKTKDPETHSWKLEVYGAKGERLLPLQILIDNQHGIDFGVQASAGDVKIATSLKWQFYAFIDEARGEYWRVSFKKIKRHGKKILQYFVECKTLDGVDATAKSLELRALTYNVYMRPATLLNDGQYSRAPQIAAAITGQDIVSFSEAFDDDIRYKLRADLKKEYFYQTSIVGQDTGHIQDGGVFIASKWPILEEDEVLFGKLCSRTFEDCLAQKGIKYARVWVKGKMVHVFATHLQNGYGKKDEQVKLGQLGMLSDFIASKVKSTSEIVLVMGDFNLKCPERAQDFLGRGIFSPLEWKGTDSYSPMQNKLADGVEETVDYVTYATGYKVPSEYSVGTMMVRAQMPWRKTGRPKFFYELSDHFPVLAKLKYVF